MLRSRILELELQLAEARKQAQQAASEAKHGKPREKIAELSAEVVDSNPYRCDLYCCVYGFIRVSFKMR